MKICRQEKIVKYEIIFEDMQSCATFETTVNLNTKLFTKTNIFQVGFQRFEHSSIIYYPNVSIKVLTPETRLIYNWISYENVKHNAYRLKTKYKLLNFAKLKYSWQMAIAKCQGFGMTLLQLENERRTIDLINYLMNEYVLPVHAIFVALVTKVRIF